MAFALVLKFANADRNNYHRVNRFVGVNMKSGKGKWPAGLLSHVAGTTEDGTLVVMEVWESRSAQRRFMQVRLGAAIQKAGVSNIPEMTWVEPFFYHTPTR